MKTAIHQTNQRDRFEVAMWRGDVEFKDILGFVMRNGAEYEDPTDVRCDYNGNVFSFAVTVQGDDERRKVTVSRGDAIIALPTYDSRDFEVMSIRAFNRIFDYHPIEREQA